MPENMKDISIIITSCNEYPSIAFTIMGLIEELEGFCDYEIIVVNNKSEDQTKDFLDEVPEDFKNKVRQIIWNERYSNIIAKNIGVQNSSGRLLFFLDAHCIMKRDSLREMINWLDSFKGKIGGIHSRARYMWSGLGKLLEWKISVKDFNHIATPARERTKSYEIATATTCGMLCKREIFDELGLWNENFGTYFGAESYMVWKHITCGYPHYMHHKAYFWHQSWMQHKYPFPEDDRARNRMITAFCIGGEEWLDKQKEAEKARFERPDLKGKGIDFEALKKEVMEKCFSDREFIKSKQIMTINEHFKKYGSI